MSRLVRIDVSPSPALVCDRIAVRVVGLEAGAFVSVESAMTDSVGVTWRAIGQFRADASGAVDLAEAPSSGGTFIGVDSSGLFWSMRPDIEEDADTFKSQARHPLHAFGRPGFDDEPQTAVTLRCRSATGAMLAEQSFSLWFRRPGIDARPLEVGRLRGRVWGPPGDDPGRGVIFVFTGSDGGVDKGYSPLLASLGYRVVGLAVFNYEDRPKALAGIDLEYFADAFAWARRTFGVTKVVIKGGSRGGELVLLLGATYPEQIGGIVADIPMHVVSAGIDEQGRSVGAWTLRGQEVPFATSAATNPLVAADDPDSIIVWRDVSDSVVKDAGLTDGTEIAVERIGCPLLLVSGEDDQIWDSAWGSDRVVDRLRAHGSPIRYQHLCLRDTGHWLGVPNRVTSLLGPIVHPMIHRRFALGGTPAGTAREAWRHWDTLVSFLETCCAGH